MTDPLTVLDNLIRNQFADYGPLQTDAGVKPSEIRLYDKMIAPSQLEYGVWIVPGPWRTDPYATSSSAGFIRRWRIGFGKRGLDTAGIRKIEWAITGAWMLLADRKGPDGNDLQIPASLTPLELGLIGPIEGEPELEPLLDAPEGWQDVCVIEATAKAKRSDVPQV